MLFNTTETQAGRCDCRLVESAGWCLLQVHWPDAPCLGRRPPDAVSSWAQRHPQEMGQPAGEIPESGHSPRSVVHICLPVPHPPHLDPHSSGGGGVTCAQAPQALVEGVPGKASNCSLDIGSTPCM